MFSPRGKERMKRQGWKINLSVESTPGHFIWRTQEDIASFPKPQEPGYPVCTPVEIGQSPCRTHAKHTLESSWYSAVWNFASWVWHLEFGSLRNSSQDSNPSCCGPALLKHQGLSPLWFFCDQLSHYHTVLTNVTSMFPHQILCTDHNYSNHVH
jgi:hypothetical protein